jgi:biotin transport system substrate-specific component
VKNIRLYHLALAGILTALIAVSAFIRIPTPFGMVFTMQIFVVLLAPMIVGPKLAFWAIIQYIIIGLAGIPIFANGGGPAYVLQPSFGFLIGYLLSAIPNGVITYKRQRLGFYLFGGFIALVIIYIAGSVVFWLNLNHVQGREISYIKSFAILAPFIPLDIVKLVLAAILAKRLRKLL